MPYELSGSRFSDPPQRMRIVTSNWIFVQKQGTVFKVFPLLGLLRQIYDVKGVLLYAIHTSGLRHYFLLEWSLAVV